MRFAFFGLVGVALLGCSRTGLLTAELESEGAPQEVPHEQPVDQQPDEQPSSGPLPELTIATTVSESESDSLVMLAPLASARGPYELTQLDTTWTAYAPGAARYGYMDEEGLFIVDSWPPEPRKLDTGGEADVFAWVDTTRLVAVNEKTLVLLDVTEGTRDTLYEVTNETNTPEGYPTLYWPHPSPSGRFIAFTKWDNGHHQIWLIDLEAQAREPVMVFETLLGSVPTWFDWAPDSEHLAFSVTDTNGMWQRPFSVSTKDGIGEVLPITFELASDETVPTFRWSPTGKALHYYYQHLIEGGETDFRLYFVDMSGAEPGESVLLSTFSERNWASQGTWSPNGEMVAFSADFMGQTFRDALFVSRPGTLGLAPQKQHTGEFSSVLKRVFAPGSDALYFTAMYSDQVERVYKADLAGAAEPLSKPATHVNALYVSSEPGCIAYNQYEPTSAVVVFKESSASYYELGQPTTDPDDWYGFSSTSAQWVDDASGLRGLLINASGTDTGDSLSWVSVNDCVPAAPEVLIPAKAKQSIDTPSVSTEPPPEERF